MKVLPPLAHCRDKRDAEAAAPVAKEVGKAGGAVVLAGLELGVSDDAERDKEESIAESLKAAGQRIVRVIGLKVEAAVEEHRCGYGDDADAEQDARMNDAALYELSPGRRQQRNDEGPGPENQPGVDRTIAIERLQQLRNHGGGGEETEAEEKVEARCDAKVAVGQQVKVDDGIVVVEFPIDGE